MADATLLILQHIAREPPAAYEDEMLRWGAGLHRVEVDEGEPLPDWRAFDGVVASIGPGADPTIGMPLP
jgi:GMP synthase (glutamine-hydrolysing)